MASIQELQQQVADLQVAVDAEQAQIQALLEGQQTTITALEAEIVRLQTVIDSSATPEQLQEVVANLQAIKTDIENTA